MLISWKDKNKNKGSTWLFREKILNETIKMIIQKFQLLK